MYFFQLGRCQMPVVYFYIAYKSNLSTISLLGYAVAWVDFEKNFINAEYSSTFMTNLESSCNRDLHVNTNGQTNRKMDMAQSTRLVIQSKNIYTL